MPKEYPRSRRVAEQIRRELSQLIRSELKDPRAETVTVTAVEVSRDISNAKIYFTDLDDSRSPEDTEHVLNGAAGFLRHALGQIMTIRSMPRLQFVFDRSVATGARMDALIDKAIQSDQAKRTNNGD
ncbi:MAG: 30S ribosome-binding factor RbfA [Gammaproteobacteria bacterium]|nr:30S ribosome-binding factor RbfA [Gammaproteobacteria bacterium]